MKRSHGILNSKDDILYAENKKKNGDVYFNKGDYASATCCYISATEILQDYVNGAVSPSCNVDNDAVVMFKNCCCNVAVCALREEKFVAVCEFASKVLAIDPEFVKALYLRAKALYKLKQPHDAFAEIVRALKISPDNRQMLNLKSQIELGFEEIRQKILVTQPPPVSSDKAISGRKLPSKDEPERAPAILNEYAMQTRQNINAVFDEHGTKNDKVFVCIYRRDQQVLAKRSASTKKVAKRLAAQAAIEYLHQMDNPESNNDIGEHRNEDLLQQESSGGKEQTSSYCSKTATSLLNEYAVKFSISLTFTFDDEVNGSERLFRCSVHADGKLVASAVAAAKKKAKHLASENALNELLGMEGVGHTAPSNSNPAINGKDMISLPADCLCENAVWNGKDKISLPPNCLCENAVSTLYNMQRANLIKGVGFEFNPIMVEGRFSGFRCGVIINGAEIASANSTIKKDAKLSASKCALEKITGIVVNN